MTRASLITVLMMSAVMSGYAEIATATSYGDRSLDALFEAADVVASGEATAQRAECGESGCVYQQEFVIGDQVKGVIQEGTMTICTLHPLDVRRTYYLFIENGAGQEILGVRCAWIAFTDGVIRDFSDTHFRYMSPNASNRIARLEKQAYLTSAIEEPGFGKKWRQWGQGRGDR